MAACRRLCVSANMCLVLILYLILAGPKWNCSSLDNKSLDDKNVYFVSQSLTIIGIRSYRSRYQASSSPKTNLTATIIAYKTCYLTKRALLAATLIALAGDVESNPGDQCFDGIKKIRGLKVAHLNVRSLRNKVDSLRLEVMNSNTFDIITLSETWLNHSISDSEIQVPGYSCIRKDRVSNTSGGGVLIYIKENLPFKAREDMSNSVNECLWIELIRPKSKAIVICCIYRPPDSRLEQFICGLQDSLALVDMDHSEIILLGDFNVDLKARPRGGNIHKRKLTNFGNAYNLSQIIKKPTRIAENSQTLIDLIFVNNEHRIVDHGVIPLPVSDHCLVYCIVKAGIIKSKPKIIEYRSYKNYNVKAFLRDLNNVPWHIVDNEENIDDAVLTWNKLFCDVVDEHAPIKKRRMKGIHVPWMTSKLTELMHSRDYHHRKARKSQNSNQWNVYKKLRNKVNREIRISKSRYYNDLINECKGNTKQIWKVIDEASSRKAKPSTPSCIITDGTKFDDPKSIAATLNKYFVSIGKFLADQITSLCLPTVSMITSPSTYFNLREVSELSVLKQLLSLKTNKAIGLDKIGARVLKDAAETITPSVTKLLNLSIRTHIFPRIWKSAKVSALFKGGDSSNPTNYRPISVLPTLAKILERIVHVQLYNYLNTNKLITDKQFGFRSKYSTTAALTDFTDNVLHGMDKGKLCGAVFLDLTKAFDSVDHQLLFHKLSYFGISAEDIIWFKSYLQNRTQRTVCGKEQSDPLLISHGVPQGSILGPLLFIMFTNDLPSKIQNSNVSLYADDTIIYYSSSSMKEIEDNLNDDLVNVAKWFNENKLTLNLEKTKAMLIGSDKKICKENTMLSVKIHSEINIVNTFKYLGVTLSANMSWANHIENLTSKVNQRLGLLYRIKHLLPFHTRLLYFNSLVLPIMDYADLIWGDKNNLTLMDGLQILQNKAAKIILDKSMYSSSSEALADLQWHKLCHRRHFHRCLYIFKCINGYTAHHLELMSNSDVHNYNTRRKDNIRLPKVNTNWGKQRIEYHAVNEWNNLPNGLKQFNEINVFKKEFFMISK